VLTKAASVHFIWPADVIEAVQIGLAAPFNVDPAFDVNADTHAIVAPETTSNTPLAVTLDVPEIVAKASGTRWPADVADDVPATTLAPFSVFSFMP
jgi:hypothetical protein